MRQFPITALIRTYNFRRNRWAVLPRAELPYTSSGYYECVAHIEAFNNRLRSLGRTPVHIWSPAYFALHGTVGDPVEA